MPRRELANAIRELVERRPPNPADPVERAVLAAVVDRRVQDAIVAHLERGELFLGAGPLPRDSAMEHVAVVLEFRVLPPRIAFIPPLIAVRVNLETGEVGTIVDPFRGEPMGRPAIAAAGFFPRGPP